MRRKINLIYVDAGGGHRAAATALTEVIRREERPWDLSLLNIQELLNPIDFIRKSTGIPFEELYNIMLRRNWTLGSAQMIPMMHAMVRLLHREQVRILEKHWKSDRPDMVVSLIPHYNRALKDALERCWPGVPLVTILTDIADYPPHFWIERQDQYVICGSARAVEQARLMGLPKDHVFQVSGMILNPKFYLPITFDRRMERLRRGLRSDLPTGLVLFGGQGSMDIVKIARTLNESVSGVQLILLCGRHEQAEQILRSLPHEIPMLIEGFTSEVSYYMALSDFFIGKAGPGSISEALAMRLPVIVERNAWTLAHERYNADWIEEQELGIVINNFSKIGQAVVNLLEKETYSRYRNNAAAIRNFAVFEIPTLLDSIFADLAGETFIHPSKTDIHENVFT